MLARIYKPAKTAMQSGEAKTKRWVLEFAPAVAREIDPLMGWTSSSDMNSQVQMFFDSKERAVAFATKHKIPHEVEEPQESGPREGKSYSDNFRYARVEPWTH